MVMPSEYKRPISDGLYSEWLPYPGSGFDSAYVNAFSEVQRNGLWEYVGESPYLNASDDGNEVKTKTDGADCGDFSFGTINRSVETITNVKVGIATWQEGTLETLTPCLYDGNVWHQLETKTPATWGGPPQQKPIVLLEWEISSILNTWEKINSAKLHFVYAGSGKLDYVHVDTGYIWVSWTSGTNYDKVDDPIGSPDDETTNVETDLDTLWRRDLYNLESFTLPENNKIDKVVLFMRSRGVGFSLAANPPSCNFFIRTHSTNYEYDGPNLDDIEWHEDTHELAANPNTGQAWTEDEVNALQSGIRGQSNEFEYLGETWWNTVRCTQVYIIVYYSPITEEVAKIQYGDGLTCVSVG